MLSWEFPDNAPATAGCGWHWKWRAFWAMRGRQSNAIWVTLTSNLVKTWMMWPRGLTFKLFQLLFCWSILVLALSEWQKSLFVHGHVGMTLRLRSVVAPWLFAARNLNLNRGYVSLNYKYSICNCFPFNLRSAHAERREIHSIPVLRGPCTSSQLDPRKNHCCMSDRRTHWLAHQGSSEMMWFCGGETHARHD